MRGPRFLFLLISLFFVGADCSAQAFVQARGGRFYRDGLPYYYVGANYWYGGLLAQGKDKAKGAARIRRELDFLQSQGISNLRVLAAAEGSGLINGITRVGPALQPKQGSFNESVLDGLDFVLAEMGKRHMTAVLMLSNNWEWSGGFLQYLNWNGLLADSVLRRPLSWDEFQDNISRFYGCRPCTEAYNKQVRLLLSRRNRITGKRYADDPTIMSWELANEPRPMRPAADSAYIHWIRSTAAIVHKMAPRQLVSLGHEGWIGTVGMELFKEAHRGAAIDYLTIHIWPKNWGWFRPDSLAAGFDSVAARTLAYISDHEAVARRLGKPLVLEEFGLPRDENALIPASATTWRDRYFKLVYDAWKASASSNGVLAGANFWAFSGFARPHSGQPMWKPGDDYSGDPPMEPQGLNGVFDADAGTWALIRSYTGKRQPEK